MFVVGVIVLGITICLCYVAYYHLEVKHRNEFGLREIGGFGDYAGGKILRFFVGLLLNIAAAVGFGLLLFGFISMI